MLSGKYKGRGGPRLAPRRRFGPAWAADPTPYQPKWLRTDAICDSRNAIGTSETGCDDRSAYVLHNGCTSEYIAATKSMICAGLRPIVDERQGRGPRLGARADARAPPDPLVAPLHYGAICLPVVLEFDASFDRCLYLPIGRPTGSMHGCINATTHRSFNVPIHRSIDLLSSIYLPILST